MTLTEPQRRSALLAAIPILTIVVHLIYGNQYGFHRDELQFLIDGRHLAWGFVPYPPMTAFLGRLSTALLGVSPLTFRIPAALANAVALLCAARITRTLGGSIAAQLLAMLAMLPVSLALGSLMQYVSFDYLAWTLLAVSVAELLRSDDERWWLAAGAAVGFGGLSKYSIAFPVAGLLIGMLGLPSQRKHFRSKWFYAGAGVALLVIAPHLVWEAKHHFVTLTMLQHIHARDVRIGRADHYLADQLKFTLLAFPLVLAGLVWLVRSERFRLLSFLYLGPLVLLLIAKGRGYYLLPGYVSLYAAGALVVHRLVPRKMQIVYAAAQVVTLFFFEAKLLPVFKPGSPAFMAQVKQNEDLQDEIGWREIVADVAHVRDSIPVSQRSRLAVLAANYGEAGALSLYGPEFGLPEPISTVNSFHERGFGPYPPETLVVIGVDPGDLRQHFKQCSVEGHIHIPFGVENEESRYDRDIYVCHTFKENWAEFWPGHQSFG